MSWDLSVSDIAGIVTLLSGLLLGFATAYATYKKGNPVTPGKATQPTPAGIPVALAEEDRKILKDLASSFEKMVSTDFKVALSETDRIAHEVLVREIQHLSVAISVHGRQS